MAHSGAEMDSVSCPICLDLLKAPVTTPCGHSYCMKCINLHWDQQSLRYSCPECRQSFSPRPALARNILLSDLVEQLKATRFTAPPADHSCAGPQDAQGAQRRRALLLQNLQNKEAEVESLRQQAQDISRAAQTAVQLCGDSFREMALLLEQRHSEVEQRIRTEELSQLRRVRELQDQLQQDMTELRRSMSELDTLSLTPKPLCPSPQTTDTRTDTVTAESSGSLSCFKDVARAVFALRDKLQLALKEDLTNVSLASAPVHVLCSPAPSSREDFLQYSTEITFDPNSVHPLLSLSDGDTRVTLRAQSYPDHPDRFSVFRQVLSRESLSGRCYWEVEWSGKWLRVAASYGDIQRKGDSDDCLFGCNEKSWALHCDGNGYSFRFNSVRSEVFGPVSSRIGVFLDHSAGVLAFYSVSATITLLHRVQTNFTRPLLAGVGLGWCNNGDTACFPKLT